MPALLLLFFLLPVRIRGRLVRLLPYRHQVAMIRKVARARYAPVLPARRSAPVARTAGSSPVTVRVRTAGLRSGNLGGALTASVLETTSPARARRHNLARVVAALDAAQVPWFRVPYARAQRTRIAVPAQWRTGALAALARSEDMAGAEIRGRTAEPAPRPLPLREAPVAEVFWTVTDPGRSMVLAQQCACDVEFWTADGDHLVSPREPRVTPPVHRDSPVAYANERDFGQFCAFDDSGRFPTRRELLLAGMNWVRFPVDAVYTWVDGSDPQWLSRKNAALAAHGRSAVHPEAANDSRYLSRDELRHSLRSLHYFAPWIRRVFIVTDSQVPPWLDPDHPWITIVDHRDILAGAARLPTFNSHAIETRLHHIPDLAEHFLYLNDDVFLGRPLTPDMFFLPSGVAKFFPTTVPVEAGPVVPDDPPIMSAGKNNRDLVAARFGRLLTQKLKHTPHPQRRSVLAEIERNCADQIRATAAHPFRSGDDISLPSSLQHYWSYLTGRSVPGNIRYEYTDLADPQTPLRLMTLLRYRHHDIFCLNDTRSTPAEEARVAKLLDEFLPAYFPFPTPFETAPVAAPKQPLAVPLAPDLIPEPIRQNAEPIA